MWTLDECRFVYNQMVIELNGQRKPNKYELKRHLPLLKEKYPELKGVYSQVLQNGVYRLFWNLKSLSQLKKRGRKVGRLRFKGRGWFKLSRILKMASRSLKQRKGSIFFIYPKLGICL